jgi:hypothetical protein
MNIGSQLLLEENQPIFGVPPTTIIPGTQLIARGVYVFECPLCKKEFRHNDRFEPICTGPCENRDDHAPEVMRLLRCEPRKVIV